MNLGETPQFKRIYTNFRKVFGLKEYQVSGRRERGAVAFRNMACYGSLLIFVVRYFYLNYNNFIDGHPWGRANKATGPTLSKNVELALFVKKNGPLVGEITPSPHIPMVSEYIM